MQKNKYPRRLVQLNLKNVILFTLAFLLTITPSTFAKQPENSPLLIQAQTIKSTVNQAQQLLEQGEALYKAGYFQRAIAILQQALGIYQEKNNNLGAAAALTNLSLIYQQIGAWEEAGGAINSSLKLLGWDNSSQEFNINQPKSELWIILAQTLDIKAELLLKQGKPNASLEISQQAGNIWNQLNDKMGMTRNSINQAQALRVSGFYDRSLDILKEIDKNLENQPNSPIKVTALRTLGNTHQQLGNLEESEKVLQKSLTIAQNLQKLQENNLTELSRLQLSQEIALTELSLGNTARSLNKDDIKIAIQHYQNAAKFASNSLTKTQAKINQFSLLVDREKTAEAKKLIPKIQSQLANLPIIRTGIYARINFARTLTQAQMSNKQDIAEILATAAKQAKIIGDERAESYALGSLAEVYKQDNQQQSALDLTKQALSLTEKNNASDIAYLWEWQLGRLLKAQGNISEAISAYDSAVATLGLLRNDLAAVNREVQFNFRDGIEPIYRESVELLLHNQDEVKPDLDKVRQRIEALQLAELDNYFREACLNNQFVVLDKFVDEDNPDTAIVYPIILDNQLEIILKLPKQKQLIHKTSEVSNQELEQIITQLRDKIVQPDEIQQFKQASAELYKWLIKPVENELKKSQVKIKNLVFIPDGSLRNIPMAALYDGKKYLVEKYAIAISPGLQLFTPKSLTRQKLNALAGGLSEMPKHENFQPLPNVGRELESIEESGVSTVKLYNETFRSDILQQKINAQPFQVIHFATHGQFSSDPKETFILASDKRIQVAELNNLLKSREQKRTEPIELLVLSACQTATGDNRAVLGLAGVALSAGARSTLASLWQIDDAPTADFINEFYNELMSRETTAEALRFAQLKILQSPKYKQHPRYWAPYILVGNWL